MTVEYVSFLLLLLVAIVTLVVDERYFFHLIYFPFFILYIFIVRFSGYDIDIEAYAHLMTLSHKPIYILREYGFWGLIRGLYNLLKNPTAVFLVLDFSWIILLVWGLRVKFGDKWHKIFVVLVTSFPFFLGYQNIYRQFLGMVIIAVSLLIREKKEGLSNLLFLISASFHNTTLMFLPALLLVKTFSFSFKTRIILHNIVAVCEAVVLSFAYTFLAKSSRMTGLDLSLFYLLLVIGLSLPYLYKYLFRFETVISKLPLLYSAIVMMAIFITSPMESSGIERLGFYCLTFVMIDLYNYAISREDQLLRYKRYYGLLELFLFSLPVLVFPSASEKLLTQLFF